MIQPRNSPRKKKLAPSTPALVPFIRPPFNALLLVPLGWLPFGVAFAGWILLQIAVLIVCLAWAWRCFGTPALLFACMSMPTAVFAATTAASLLVAPHAYGYDATVLLLGLWLTMFSAALQPARIVALWLFTPLAYGFTLAGKPWAAVSSLSLLALVIALACEAIRDARKPIVATAMRGDPTAEAHSPL
jgi:hypothetical protein